MRPDAALHGFSPPITDPASLGEFFAGMWAAVPDAHVEIDDAFGDGGDHVAHEHLPLHRRRPHRRARNVADFLTTLQQIGAVPAPA